jgi:hypothetical protein
MWKRRLALVGLLGVLFAGLLLGWHFYSNSLSDKEFQDAVSEADRLDPGWRLEELEAKRAVIPDAENLAEHVLAIKAMMPQSWPPESMTKVPEPRLAALDEESTISVEEAIYELPPELQMNSEQIRELRAAMELVKEPLAQARSLSNFRAGRYRVNWSQDYESTPTPWGNYCRSLTNLLGYDARLRAQDGDIDGALISVLAILSVARSFGDEPIMISQIVRRAQSGVATQALERILAQGQGSAKSLMNVQHAFRDEASQPLFLFGVRGERAGLHQMMQAVESGKIKASSVIGFGATGKLEKWFEDVSGELEIRRSHAPLLRAMTEIVAIAKLPVEEQPTKIKTCIRSTDHRAYKRELPVYVGLMMPLVEKFAEGCWRNQALLRCAIVVLAVERYRIAHGRWPDSLSVLVPEYLEKIHLDPYDAKPLRYRRLVDGVIIYSVGPDEKDDGGKLDRQNPSKLGTDIGFQLWDANHRRQPWRPPTKTAE